MASLYRLLLVLILLPAGASAQTVEEVLKRHWRAIRYTGKDSTVDHIYNLQFDSSGNYTGRFGTAATIRGKKYTCITNIKGKYKIRRKGKEVSLSFLETSFVSRPEPNPDTDFCLGRGTLYLYRDKDKISDYFLEGDIICDGGQNHLVFR